MQSTHCFRNFFCIFDNTNCSACVLCTHCFRNFFCIFDNTNCSACVLCTHCFRNFFCIFDNTNCSACVLCTHCFRNSVNTRNPLICFANRYFLVFRRILRSSVFSCKHENRLTLVSCIITSLSRLRYSQRTSHTRALRLLRVRLCGASRFHEALIHP